MKQRSWRVATAFNSVVQNMRRLWPDVMNDAWDVIREDDKFERELASLLSRLESDLEHARSEDC